MNVRMFVKLFFLCCAVYTVYADNCTCKLGKQSNTFSANFGVERIYKFPWTIKIVQFHFYRCHATLLTTKHILTTAKCILPGHPMENLKGDSLPKSFWMPYTDIIINNKNTQQIKFAYIHHTYAQNPNEFAPAIIELKEDIHLSENTQPAYLPITPLDIDPTYRLPIAVSYHIGSSAITKRVDVRLFSEQACQIFNNGQSASDLMCIDIEEASPDCDLCLFDFNQPIFHVMQDGSMVLLGMPKYCKKHAFLLNEQNCVEEKSAAVYVPIGNYLNWIHSIINKRCKCKDKVNLIDTKEAIIFANSKVH